MNKTNLVLAIAGIMIWSLVVYTVALAVYQSSLAHSGEITSVETQLYGDKAQTTQITSLSWGLIGNGTQNNLTVYVKNVGNKNMVLSLTIQNLPSFLTLAWNYTGASIPPSSAVPVKFTLAAAPNATGTFNFHTKIVSTEA